MYEYLHPLAVGKIFYTLTATFCWCPPLYAQRTQTTRLFARQVNDETPVVVNNTGLEVWAGSRADITSDRLSKTLKAKVKQTNNLSLCAPSSFPGASDADSPADKIWFHVTSATQIGFVSLKTRPDRSIDRFRQADITAGNVIFTHTGRSQKCAKDH